MDDHLLLEVRQVWEPRQVWLLLALVLHQASSPTINSLDGQVAFLKGFNPLPTCPTSTSMRQSYVWVQAGLRSQAYLSVLIQGGESRSNDQLEQVWEWMHNDRQSEKA